MKRYLFYVLFILFVQPVVASTTVPEGVIKEGSLANRKLISDAMVGVAAEVATRGCDSPANFMPYVTAMPKGKVGARYWRELWVVEGCGTEYSVEIIFSEDGLHAANWSIE